MSRIEENEGSFVGWELAAACVAFVWGLGNRLTGSWMKPQDGSRRIWLPSETPMLVRDMVALALLFLAHVFWLGWSFDLSAALNATLEGTITNVLTVFASVVVACVVLAVGAFRHGRATLVELVPPLKASAALALGTLWLPAIWYLVGDVDLPDPSGKGVGPALLSLLCGLLAVGLLIAAGVLYASTLINSVRLTLKHRLRVAEAGRAVLPVTILLSSFASLFWSYGELRNGWPRDRPHVVTALFALFGPVTGAGLMIWNLTYLRRHGGITTPVADLPDHLRSARTAQ